MSHRKLSIAFLMADLLCSVFAMATAVLLRYGAHWNSLDRDSAVHLLPFLGAAWIVWIWFSLFLPLDGFRGGWRLSAVIAQLILATSGLMLVLLSGGYLARSYVSRLALIYFCSALLAGLVFIRVAAYVSMKFRSKNGFARRVVIVGQGRLARELASKIERHPEMLCKVVGFLSPDEGMSDFSSSAQNGHPAIRTGILGVVDLLVEQQTHEVILALQECATPDLINLADHCRRRSIKVSLVPQFYELYLSRSKLHDLDGLPILQLARGGPSGQASIRKRVLDLLLGTLFSVIAIPILLPIVILVSYMKGKAFRWETRCGLRGQPFAMLRLNIDRTSSNNSQFEELLRKFSLTELPQLWNVLRGEMSLVGPRPEPADRVRYYSDWEHQRLNIKPGMTGLAQVQGLREQHSSEDKTHFDLQYLLNCSVWTDLSLLLQTVWTLATRSSPRRSSTPEIDALPMVESAVVANLQEEVVVNAHRP